LKEWSYRDESRYDLEEDDGESREWAGYGGGTKKAFFNHLLFDVTLKAEDFSDEHNDAH